MGTERSWGQRGLGLGGVRDRGGWGQRGWGDGSWDRGGLGSVGVEGGLRLGSEGLGIGDNRGCGRGDWGRGVGPEGG